MKETFAKLSPFQVDPARVEIGFTADDFEKASADEKISMVETRKSVSYWRDAWRRFRKNTVSMVSLLIFLMVLFFAFIGPYMIPYNYANQYRSSQKLDPGKYSEKEALIKSVEDKIDYMFATALQPGSITALSPGDYYMKYKGKAWCFSLEKTTGDTVFGFIDGDFVMISERDIRDGEITAGKLVDCFTTTEKDARAQGYVKLDGVRSVFPHVFGTDSTGRDIMARTMYGARVSIIIGVVAAVIVLIIGSIYGSISGLAGGRVDFIMQRIVELIYSIPEVLIVLLLQVVLKDPLQNWFDSSNTVFAKAMSDLGSGIVSIFITFAVLYWVTMARIVRGQVLQLKKQEYVTAATALGASNARIIRRHLLPNCVGQLVITTCLQIPSAIFLESFLSFLGLGVSAPMASLGSLCSDAIATISLYPYRLIYPAVVLTIIVLTLNLVGDGLRDALDPRLKK